MVAWVRQSQLWVPPWLRISTPTSACGPNKTHVVHRAMRSGDPGLPNVSILKKNYLQSVWFKMLSQIADMYKWGGSWRGCESSPVHCCGYNTWGCGKLWAGGILIAAVVEFDLETSDSGIVKAASSGCLYHLDDFPAECIERKGGRLRACATLAWCSMPKTGVSVDPWGFKREGLKSVVSVVRKTAIFGRARQELRRNNSTIRWKMVIHLQ